VRRAQRVTAAMIESYRQRQGGFPQRFLACLAPMELEGVVLEET
jgi:hypothetical protein